MNVKVDELANAVNDMLEEYKNLAADEMKTAVKAAGRTVKEDINASAPVRTGKYAKSWTNRVTAESSTGIAVTVYSPSRYMLAHLLENGHAKRGGGRVRAIPHIKPAEDHGIEQLERDLARALGKG
ncbi:MAG: HK97 gp10 family phage protein [Clostridia bacterium]|nr:HK97 gp10 family phage protein [Clostridia bacterium]